MGDDARECGGAPLDCVEVPDGVRMDLAPEGNQDGGQVFHHRVARSGIGWNGEKGQQVFLR